MELTNEELEILFDAITAWEQQPVRDGMMGLVLETMLIKDKDERDAATERAIAEQEQSQKARERKAILLKAKIVMAIEAGAADALFGNGAS